MPTFNAGAYADALDWDFTEAGVKEKGTVPEPSDRKIGDFLDGLKKLYEGARADGIAGDIPADASPDQMLEAITALTGDKFVTFMADTAELFAELCGGVRDNATRKVVGGKPSAGTLLKLPLRVRVGFYAWIQGQVVSPEVGPGAGIAAVRSLPSAAAG